MLPLMEWNNTKIISLTEEPGDIVPGCNSEEWKDFSSFYLRLSYRKSAMCEHRHHKLSTFSNKILTHYKIFNCSSIKNYKFQL